MKYIYGEIINEIINDVGSLYVTWRKELRLYGVSQIDL